jgi:hypothetical protein
VRTIERTVVVRFEDAEILFEEGAVHAVGRRTPRSSSRRAPSTRWAGGSAA